MIIAYIDDEQKELDRLKSIISEFLTEEIVFDTFLSSSSFFKNWQMGKYDLIFLDIYIDISSGIDIARQIRKTDSDVLLAFCTTSNEFASESYEVNARYYLQKPFSIEKVKLMLDRLRFDELERQRTIKLSNGQCILPYHITYTEYFNHKILLHTDTHNIQTIKLTQTELEELLCPYPFFISCFKGMTINLYAVDRIDDNTIYMKNNETVPVSRRKQKIVSESYDNFRFNRLRKGDML